MGRGGRCLKIGGICGRRNVLVGLPAGRLPPPLADRPGAMRDHIPHLPTADDVEAHIEVEVASNSPASPAEGQRLRRRFQNVPVAETFPVFASVRSDRAGHLWVEEYEFPREERPAPLWTVFDPEGRALGLVETPKDRLLSPITGFPALTVPAGFTPEGLPVGLEFLGRPFTEAMLLRFGYAFEQGTGYRRPPESAPPLGAGR